MGRGVWFLISMLTVGAISVHGQMRTADSLKNLMDRTTDPMRKVDLLLEVALDNYDYDDSVALLYSRQALLEATRIHYPNGIKQAHTLIGLGSYGRGDYREVLKSCRLSNLTSAPDGKGIAIYNLTLMGNVYRDLALYDSSLYYYNLALSAGKDGASYYLVPVYRNLARVNLILWKNKEASDYLATAERLAVGRASGGNLLNIYNLYGLLYENLLQYEKAEDYFSRLCKLSAKSETRFYVIRCYLNQADLALRKGDFSESLKRCFDALHAAEVYQYPPQLADIYTKIGEVYEELSQFELSSNYFFMALKITERLGLRYQTAIIYSELAWINKDQMNLDLALDYIDRSQAIRTDIKEDFGISNCENVRGLIYFLQKKYDKSIQEFDKALEIRKRIGHERGVAATIFNSSLVYSELNQLDKALAYQKEAIAIEERLHDKEYLVSSYNDISGLLIKLGRLAEAEQFLKQAIHLADDLKSRTSRRNVYKTYATLYEIKRDFAMANEFRKKYQALNDTIFSSENAVKLAEMQALYQVEKKEQEVQLLQQQKQIQEDEIKIQNVRLQHQSTIIIGVIVCLVLAILTVFIGTLYYQDKNKAHRQLTKLTKEIVEQKEEIQAQSEELIEANQTISQINQELERKIETRTSELKQAYKELDTFFYRSSHDFRRPLTTFLGLAEVAKITVKDTNALELFDKVQETAHNLDKMLVKLQSISDLGTQQLVYKEVFVKELVGEIAGNYESELVKRQISFHDEINSNGSFFSYPAMVRIILENLIENAIHFAGMEKPYIKVGAYDQGADLIIEVTDNGHGIHAEYHDRVFDMYFRGSEHSKGNGLGLYIVKKAVEKLSGKISFQSSYGLGSTFIITLPRGN